MTEELEGDEVRATFHGKAIFLSILVKATNQVLETFRGSLWKYNVKQYIRVVRLLKEGNFFVSV